MNADCTIHLQVHQWHLYIIDRLFIPLRSPTVITPIAIIVLHRQHQFSLDRTRNSVQLCMLDHRLDCSKIRHSPSKAGQPSAHIVRGTVMLVAAKRERSGASAECATAGAISEV